MPLIECVGGHLDGQRFEVPRLDPHYVEGRPDGCRTDYFRVHRYTEDGQAEVYAYRFHDDAYVPLMKIAVAAWGSHYPEHRIDYVIKPHSIDFRITHNGKTTEHNLEEDIRMGRRPDEYAIRDFIRLACKADV